MRGGTHKHTTITNFKATDKIEFVSKDFFGFKTLEKSYLLKQYSEEYSLKIDNGEQRQYELATDALSKCVEQSERNELERKINSLKKKTNIIAKKLQSFKF